MRDIEHDTFSKLILSLPLDLRDAYVCDVTRGSYHYVAFMKTISNKGLVEEVVIKVPGQGPSDRWTAQDEYMLIREV
jgi:hypothetical protein